MLAKPIFHELCFSHGWLLGLVLLILRISLVSVVKVIVHGIIFIATLLTTLYLTLNSYNHLSNPYDVILVITY